ncbi:MAG TPA: mammalian cell entry protein, partial [Mycobacterium sp.]|nr:mammalian cell entry protein [Mycobacterium sp.]
EQLITGLAADRDPVGTAIEALNQGTASMSDLLGKARPPLAGTIDQLNRIAPLLEKDKELLDISLQKAPANYRKLVRLGAYGSFLNQYLCGMSVRVTDLQGRTAYFPWIIQQHARCGEP